MNEKVCLLSEAVEANILNCFINHVDKYLKCQRKFTWTKDYIDPSLSDHPHSSSLTSVEEDQDKWRGTKGGVNNYTMGDLMFHDCKHFHSPLEEVENVYSRPLKMRKMFTAHPNYGSCHSIDTHTRGWITPNVFYSPHMNL